MRGSSAILQGEAGRVGRAVRRAGRGAGATPGREGAGACRSEWSHGAGSDEQIRAAALR